MIQHRVKLTDDTPIRCKLYPLQYAMRKELRNEVNSMLECGIKYMSKIDLTKGYSGCVQNSVCESRWTIGVFTDPIRNGEFVSYSCPRTEESSRGIVRSR